MERPGLREQPFEGPTGAQSKLGKNKKNRPDRELLLTVLHDDQLVATIAGAPGGWRTLSEHELLELGLTCRQRLIVDALQELVSRNYTQLLGDVLQSSSDVARVYGQRLGGLMHETLIAVALDGRNNVLGEIEIANGGAHSIAVTPRDVLRPLIRIGASAFLLVHNHPSGDPTPSREDVHLTLALATCAEVVGIALVDHVVVAGRGGGFRSLYDLGVLDSNQGEEAHGR